MKPTRTIVSAALLALVVAAGGSAQGMGYGRGFRPGIAGAANAQTAPPLTALKDYLGLTDQQVQQITDMRRKAAEDNRTLAEQARTIRQQIADLMKSANPDPARIGQLHLDLRKLHEQRLAKLEQVRTQALTVLNAEQKQKLADLEKALSLGPAARQAAALGLIAPPQRGAGAGVGRPFGLRGMRPGRAGGGWI
jgi:Spy/CpxP family protein refolding chaperone